MNSNELECIIISNGVVQPALPVRGTSLKVDHLADFPTFRDQLCFTSVIAQQATMLDASKAVGCITVGGFVGAAFYVSPTIVCTAAHNLYGDYDQLHPGPITLSMGNKLHGRGGTYTTLELVGDDSVKSRTWFNKGGPFYDPIKKRLLPINGDFAFLNAHQQSEHYLLPQVAQEKDIVATIGFPALQDIDELLPYQKQNIGFMNVVCALGEKMGHKIVSPGTVTKEVGGILSHTCSALKGNSGGPVVLPTSGRFTAIHTVGPADTNHNVSFSTGGSLFKELYAQLVYPTLPLHSQSVVHAYVAM